mgnify:FL=1
MILPLLVEKAAKQDPNISTEVKDVLDMLSSPFSVFKGKKEEEEVPDDITLAGITTELDPDQWAEMREEAEREAETEDSQDYYRPPKKTLPDPEIKEVPAVPQSTVMADYLKSVSQEPFKNKLYAALYPENIYSQKKRFNTVAEVLAERQVPQNIPRVSLQEVPSIPEGEGQSNYLEDLYKVLA